MDDETPMAVRFWFDPVCPFAWLASRWVHEVASLRPLEVEWRLISLLILNHGVDYDSHFPPGYSRGHTTGLRLLRLCAAVREEVGAGAVGPLYTALGERFWEVPPPDSRDELIDHVTSGPVLEEVLAGVGAPRGLAGAVDDESWDEAVREDTTLALSLTGEDVGTPIVQVDAPDGHAFFGPVLSRVPRGDEAVALWDHVVGLSRFTGFAELKRSLRDSPQLPVLGWTPEDDPSAEDWHAGARAADRPAGATD